MAAITFEHFKAQLLPQLDAMTIERGITGSQDQEIGWMNEIFRPVPTTNLQEEYANQQRKGPWEFGGESTPYPRSEWDDPTHNSVGVQRIRDGFDVTDEWVKYGDRTKQIHLLQSISDKINDFVDSGLRTMAQYAASILLDAFTGSLMTTPDGDALCSDSHTHEGVSISYDNYLTNKFSAGSLQAIWDLNSRTNLVDSKGFPLFIHYDTLVISPDYDTTVNRVLDNEVDPDATNNSKNFWRDRIKRVIYCPFLRDAVQSGSQHFWFVFDSQRYSAWNRIVEMPHLIPAQDPMNPDLITFLGKGIFQPFFKSWQGWAGSSGVAAAL